MSDDGRESRGDNSTKRAVEGRQDQLKDAWRIAESQMDHFMAGATITLFVYIAQSTVPVNPTANFLMSLAMMALFLSAISSIFKLDRSVEFRGMEWAENIVVKGNFSDIGKEHWKKAVQREFTFLKWVLRVRNWSLFVGIGLIGLQKIAILFAA